MAQWLSDQLNLASQGLLGGTAVGGVSGGAMQASGIEVRAVAKLTHFTFRGASPNPALGSPPGAYAIGDTFILAQANDPDQRIWMGRVYVQTAFAASSTMSFGKLDLNNSTNTDPVHYLAAASIAATGLLEFNLNMTEQVGATPIGDSTPGQQLPQFGSAPILITGTVAGAAPGATGVMNGFVMLSEESN